MLKNNNRWFHVFGFILIGFIFSINTNAQNLKDPTIGISNRVYVQYTDSLVETFYYKGEKKIKTRDELFYYWYAAQDIKHTRGGYEGRILHGAFIVFYYNKDLLTKGSFKYGLKHGEWRSWHRGGEIKSKEIWKKGTLVGKSYYYTNKGKIQKESYVKRRSGDGYVKLYDENGVLTSKQVYKKNALDKEITYQLNEKGKLVEVKPEKIKKSFTKEPKKNKRSSEKQSTGNKEKRVKEKKQKTPKIKVQKYRQIVPGGAGA